MGLPVVFLVGLMVLFGAREFAPPIAGSGEFDRLATASIALAVPSLLVVLARMLLRLRIGAGQHGGRAPGVLLRLSMSASPLAILWICTWGGWLDFSWRWAGGSDFAGLVLMLLPLLVVEVPRIILSTQAGVWIEVGYDVLRSAGLSRATLPRIDELGPIIRLRLGWILLITMPWAMLGLGLDLLGLSRELYAFVLGTSMGLTVGFLVLLVTAAIALPIWFRVAFGTSSDLPEPLGSELRHTAATLGFPPSRVLLLPTGMSAVNAMMVGPLPASRCLCVTDGLLRMLDGDALSGVVAHEVGHARMGHPGLLMLLAVVLPLLLLQPLSLLQLEDIAIGWQVAAGTGAVILAWLLVRSLAQRFELEADVASVRALGAEPCSRALREVMHGTQPVRRHLLGRLSSLHPDETNRLATMKRYEQEPTFRERFDRTGRRLRTAILLAVGFGLAVAAWVWVADWPYERAIWRLRSGDVVGAQQLLAAQDGEVPERWRESWELFQTELAAAAAIAPDATNWTSARRAFDDKAFERGVETLVRMGPAAAHPWFSLAADADRDDWLLRQQLYEMCRAAKDGNAELVEEIRSVVRRRAVPPALAEIF